MTNITTHATKQEAKQACQRMANERNEKCAVYRISSNYEDFFGVSSFTVAAAFHSGRIVYTTK